MCGSVRYAHAHKDATICGLRIIYARGVIIIYQDVESVAQMIQKNSLRVGAMPTDTGREIGAMRVMIAISTRIEKIDISMSPMRVKDWRMIINLKIKSNGESIFL